MSANSSIRSLNALPRNFEYFLFILNCTIRISVVPFGPLLFSISKLLTAANDFMSDTYASKFGLLNKIIAASLGFLQVDSEGNVNPSMLPNRIFGPGGFPVIAGGAPRTYFAGAFTAGQAKIEIVNHKLQIIEDGPVGKFVDKIFKTVFSGQQAMKYEKEILYVTERAVFRLTRQGIVLEEVAPGIDVDRDIISKMSFIPILGSSI